MMMKMKQTLSSILLACACTAFAASMDKCYISPQGSGDFSGSSAENTIAANQGQGLQKAWDQTAPGGTLFVAPGVYKEQSLRITGNNCGEKGKIKSLVGGKEKPEFISSWDKKNPGKGKVLVTLESGASNLSFRNITIKQYKCGFWSRGGNNNLSFEDITCLNNRNGIYLNGGGTKGSNNILIKDCVFKGFSKRGVRFQDGISNAKVINCNADSGGKEFATEKFQMCFAVGSRWVKGIDSDILFENCVARNAYDNAGKKYWNADGFCAEKNTRGLVWKNCKAFNCTDGGWDFKTPDAVLTNCVAFGNKRNYRIWSADGAKLTNCIGGYSVMPGGTGTSVGLHVCGNGKADVKNCTFINNQIQVDADQKGQIILKDCILAGKSSQTTKTTEQEASIKQIDCVVVTDGNYKELGMKGPKADWDGTGDNFNSKYGEKKGYYAK